MSATKRRKKETPPCDQIEVEAPRCKRCGSAARMPFHNIRRMQLTDRRITWRRTACTNCGQQRIERVVEQTQER